MRKFEQTHPWITFEVDLNRAPAHLWLQLGEARSKCEHVAGVPLRPQTAHDFNRLYLAKGVAATTAIEGNTLSEAQVLQQIEGKLKLPTSMEYLSTEVENVVGLCKMIWADARTGDPGVLSPELIKKFNRGIQQGLPVAEEVIPGEVRTHEVGVFRYRGAPPEDCEFLLERLCQWLNGPQFDPVGDDSMRLPIAILKAILAHLYLAWIHPFGDGNGRTARLVEFHILVHANVPMPSAHLLSNYYNETRARYYAALDRASKSGGDVIPFLSYAVGGFVEGLRTQLATIRAEQWDIIWGSFVFRKFSGSNSTSNTRRRDLVLDMPKTEAPVPAVELPKLTPRLAKHYAGTTAKTLSRDLATLQEMGLIEKVTGGYRTKREQILSFLPVRKEAPGGSAGVQGAHGDEI